MKNVKLFLSTVVAFLVVGISTVSAQQKQSVIISETVNTGINIEVIKPDYSIDKQDYKKKEVNATAILKKELDKWLEQGFEIKESNAASIFNSGSDIWHTVTYVLIKEE